MHVVVDIEMTLKVNGVPPRGLSLTMEANDRSGDPDRLRDELRRYTNIDMNFYGSDGKEGRPDFDWMTINIIDPDGVLKWLGIDLADTFKKAYNDKPVRISSKHSPHR
jgi:hypothetical protein